MEIPAKLKHSCSLCGYTCAGLICLESHVRKHTREKPFVCDKCKRRFSTQTHLNTHVKSLHHPKPPKLHTEAFKCYLCPYEEHSKLNFDRHVLNHTRERRFPCPQPNCEYAAKTSHGLRQHNSGKHTNERKFKCRFPNCAYRGKSKSNLRSHYVTHSDYRPFACDFEGCNYQAKGKASLKTHKLAVHHSGYKPFACSQCGFRTTNNTLLRSHGLTHTEEKPFRCDFKGCLYTTKLKISLKRHMESRHTEKTFKCGFESCSFIGPSERTLKLHKKNVHSKKIYKCPCCRYRAALQCILRYHMERHNSGQRILFCQNKTCTMHVKERDSTGGSFKCALCLRKFPKNNLLSRHLRIHTLEKPFKCPLCNYESRHRTSLINHVRAVHSTVFSKFCYDKKSTCSHCHMNFGFAEGLAVHFIKMKTAVVVLTRLQLKCEP